MGSALCRLGVRGYDRVAIALPNGPDIAAVFLGVASYATCAPLNPSLQSDEFEFYLTDLCANAIVLPADEGSPARDVAKRLGVAVLELERSREVAGLFALRGVSDDVNPPANWGAGEDVALVLHTSGTTSRPKQVPLSHDNLCTSARCIAHVLSLTSADRCLNVMPLFHIHGLVGVLLSSLSAGGSVICSAGFENDSFADLMKHRQPTWYSAVPTIHQSVLALAKERPEVATNDNLRLIRSSSSSLPPSVMAELEAVFKVPVIESYGMTEAAHQMASNPLPPAERKPGSVGVPAGPEMAIMDDDGGLLLAGQTGEIVIRGQSVTAGYVNNAEANDSAFTDGWFRTGDLGCKDDENYFFLTGRKKEMVNRGGENISPREIDEVLLDHPSVAQAVAFAVPHPTLGEDVVAAVVLHNLDAVSEKDLRQFAFARLAAIKVPSQILTVDSIPKGPTGKLQRIGMHEKLAADLQSHHVPPRNDLEKSIIAVVKQVLETSRVGVTDNFFALGGDSLKAARVLARLCDEFQVELPAVSVFLNPTPEQLSLEITRVLGEETGLLDELLDEIELMSDEEARRQVA